MHDIRAFGELSVAGADDSQICASSKRLIACGSSFLRLTAKTAVKRAHWRAIATPMCAATRNVQPHRFCFSRLACFSSLSVVRLALLRPLIHLRSMSSLPADYKPPTAPQLPARPKAESAEATKEYGLSHTMIRIKDPTKSLEFYIDKLGMTLSVGQAKRGTALFFR